MLFSKIDRLGDQQVRLAEIKKQITKGTYDGAARGNVEGWSLTDMISQQQIASSAIQGMCHINGVDTRGKKKKGGKPISNGLEVRLKVLTRQACFADSKGKRIYKDPTQPDMTLEPEAPRKGDVIRIRGDQKTEGENGGLLTSSEREYMIDNNISLYYFEDVVVDGDGCINVDCEQAMQLLRRNGKKIRKPQHQKPHSSIKNRAEGQKRRVTNWLFEEVSADYTAKKPRAPKTEAAPITVAG